MVGGLRTDGIGGYHTVAQSGNEHRTVIRMRQQLAQQRAERLAGTRKRVLLTADECIQLKREIAPLRLADLAGGILRENAYLVYGEALKRAIGLPDMRQGSGCFMVFNRLNGQIGAESHAQSLLIRIVFSRKKFLCRK